MNKKTKKDTEIKEKTVISDCIDTGEVFHPGYFLAEELEFRGMTQSELARELKISRSEMSLIINGKRNITVPLAIKLEKILDIKAETWMNFQIGYEITAMRKRMEEELKTIKVSAKKKVLLKATIAHA